MHAQNPMLRLQAALVGMLTLGVAGIASAGSPLSTSMLLLDSNQYIRCGISNVNAKEVAVEKVEAVDATGSVTLLSGALTLAPGASQINIFIFNSARCVFTVKKKKVVRAYGCVSNLGSALCLTESEAR